MAEQATAAVEAFSAGSAAPDLAAPAPTSELERLAQTHRVAEAALSRLETELETARRDLTAGEAAVVAAAIAVMVDRAADLAANIRRLERDAFDHREALAQLGVTLTWKARLGGLSTVGFPPQVPRVLAGREDHVLTGRKTNATHDWESEFDSLIA